MNIIHNCEQLSVGQYMYTNNNNLIMYILLQTKYDV